MPDGRAIIGAVVVVVTFDQLQRAYYTTSRSAYVEWDCEFCFLGVLILSIDGYVLVSRKVNSLHLFSLLKKNSKKYNFL